MPLRAGSPSLASESCNRADAADTSASCGWVDPYWGRPAGEVGSRPSVRRGGCGEPKRTGGEFHSVFDPVAVARSGPGPRSEHPRAAGPGPGRAHQGSIIGMPSLRLGTAQRCQAGSGRLWGSWRQSDSACHHSRALKFPPTSFHAAAPLRCGRSLTSLALRRGAAFLSLQSDCRCRLFALGPGPPGCAAESAPLSQFPRGPVFSGPLAAAGCGGFHSESGRTASTPGPVRPRAGTVTARKLRALLTRTLQPGGSSGSIPDLPA